MQNYHKHTSYSNVLVSDCTASYEDYIKRAKQFGHKVISSVEHGYQSNYYVPYELVQNNNADAKRRYEKGEIDKEQYESELLKFVFGAEAYWVKDRKKEYQAKDKKTGEPAFNKDGSPKMVKDRSNCHIILLAKNEEGRRDINEALSDANIDGYYGQPRVDLELLLRIKPENVMVTTACIAYWKYADIEEITLQLHKHFGENFYLEIQAHNTEAQIELNKRILRISEEYGIDIIFGYDSHFIEEKDSVERMNYISTRRKNYSLSEDDEVGWYMDYCHDNVARKRLKRQNVLNDEQIERCIRNTDKILDFDDIYLDKEIKLPKKLFGDKPQEWRDEKLRNLVYSAWEDEKKNIPEERHKEYLDGINYELQAIIDTKMSDYFLIDYEIVKEGLNNGGIITKTGRGSGVSYYVNSLLGFSNIDRFISPVKLYPDRFMSKTRILLTRSLPDLDLNLGNPEVFAAAQAKVMGGEDHARPMISYKPLQKSSAFKLYAKSQNLDFEIANNVTSQIAAYEKALKHADSQEEKDAINLYDFIDVRYHKYLDESKKYQGIINSKSQAPCGYLIYDGSIKREIGLIRCVSGGDDGDKNVDKSVITTVIDGMVAENYKFVKNDLLKVDIWLTINKIFEKAGVKTPTVPEITKLIENDEKTWEIYEKGLTMGVNQCESDFGRSCCTRYKPKNMQELTALVAALRPGFKTQLDNFLDRKPYTTGVKELDELLKESFHYVLYQECIMTYLGWLGIEQTETYAIIKKISKKKFKEKELSELKGRLLKNWVKQVGTEDGFEKTWEIVEAFAKYAFNASHAYSYAYDSVYGAYSKAHYPYEFYSVMMQHLTEKGEKDKVTLYKKEMNKLGIKEGKYKFRSDNRTFSIDRENGCINPSLSSIKNFSLAITESLYSIKDREFQTFGKLLECLRGECKIAEKRIEDLIKLDYFEEFGDINYLLEYLNVFMEFYKNNKYLTQFKKEKAFEKKMSFDIFRRNCKSEAVKTFMGIDAIKIIDEIMESKTIVKCSLHDRMLYRTEILGTLDIVDKKYAGVCVVTDINVNYSPRITLYALANGNTIPVKVSKKKYSQSPLRRGDIVRVKDQYKKPKMKKVDGQWIETDEKEWWITEYYIQEV